MAQQHCEHLGHIGNVVDDERGLACAWPDSRCLSID
jgi:hypothetical protein